MIQIPYRIKVAADVVRRDHGHLFGTNPYSVRLEARVIRAILVHAGRSRHSGFHPTTYDTAPLALHALPDWVVRRIRTGTKNKRLLALIDLALATASTISFILPEVRHGTGAITVDVDTESFLSPYERHDAQRAAAEFLRISHREAYKEFIARAGSSLCHLDFSFAARFDADIGPAEPYERLVSTRLALRHWGEWMAKAVPEGVDVADGHGAATEVRTTAGRSLLIDLGEPSLHQAQMLAAAVADMLVRSGRIRDDAPLTGPHLVQFLSELGDDLSERREERLTAALDAVHYYVDASDDEIAEAGTTREDALRRARALRDEVDPIELRQLRQAA